MNLQWVIWRSFEIWRRNLGLYLHNWNSILSPTIFDIKNWIFIWHWENKNYIADTGTAIEFFTTRMININGFKTEQTHVALAAVLELQPPSVYAFGKWHFPRAKLHFYRYIFNKSRHEAITTFCMLTGDFYWNLEDWNIYREQNCDPLLQIFD